MNRALRYAGWTSLSLAMIFAVAACADDPTPTPTPSPTAEAPEVAPTPTRDTTAVPGVTLRMEPEVLNWPLTEHGLPLGVWIYGSGLEPGQWFQIWIEDGERREEPIHYGTPDALLRVADENGEFALALGIPGREGRDALTAEMIQAPQAPLEVRMEDMDTGELLATTTWRVCGLAREAPWCSTAQELARLLPEVEAVVLEAGSTYVVSAIVMEDNLFELRMGSDAYWGYDPDSRPKSNAGDGLVLAVRVGDTIHVETLRQSGSRSTKPHHLTIEGLGIEHDLSVDRVEPFEIGPFTEPGEYIIDDSSDPGEHGGFKIVVTE
ncbi:MAG: hypothetical protein V3T24_02850 [Longimicrobiales bacterium]